MSAFRVPVQPVDATPAKRGIIRSGQAGGEERMSEAEDLRAVAFHEAGHAIVARDFNLAISEIEIGIDGDPTSGATKTDCTGHLSFIKQLALCIAGTMAQEMFNAHAHAGVGRGDALRMATLLDGLPKAEQHLLRRAGYTRAHEILNFNKADVERLAQRLMRDRRIGP